VLAAAAALGTLLVGGYVGPIAITAVLVLPVAVRARVLARAIRVAVVASLPVAVSVVLVTALTRAGATPVATLGPFIVTAEALDAAAQFALRLIVIALAFAVLGLTTPTRAILADLERRGVSPRLAFALGGIAAAIPALVARAATVRDAQRARGFELDGSVGRRVRGVPALAGPVLLGALADVEVRSLALEARAFGQASRRDLLWAPADDAWQARLRWLLGGFVAVMAAARLAGVLPPLP
jgi:energy-coupling factor transport system permease protein